MLGIVVIRVAGAALVEGHDDVRTDRALDVHHLLRREEVLRSVDVRAEEGALLVQFAILREGKDLKAAAVGQDRFAPGVEAMQAARLFEDSRSGAQIEVIGVAQDDLRLNLLLQFREMHPFDGALRADRHKNRCLDGAVIGRDQPRPCVRERVGML